LERCEGPVKGYEKLYLKLEGYESFSNAILDVSFDASIPPSPSPYPDAVICPKVLIYSDGPAPSIYDPLELPEDSWSVYHYGEARSVCSYYVNAPENAAQYEAYTFATGDLDLFVSTESEPMSGFTDGAIPSCYSTGVYGDEYCWGDLEGSEKVFLKIEGYTEFSDATVSVNFYVPGTMGSQSFGEKNKAKSAGAQNVEKDYSKPLPNTQKKK